MGDSTILGIAVDIATGDKVYAANQSRPNEYLENLANAVIYTLMGGGGVFNRSPDHPVIDTTNARIDVPPTADPIMGVIYGQPFIMTSAMEASGTADSGTTTELVDNARSEANDFWEYAWVIFTSGANSGSVRQVNHSVSATGTLTWTTPLASTVSAGDGYTVTFYYIQDKTNSATNYVYGRTLGNTAPDGVIQWIANTTGVKAAGDILIATMTLDSSGNVTASDNSPSGMDRDYWSGMGQVHQTELTGTVTGLAAAATVDVTRTHDDLILLGPVVVTTSDSDVTGAVASGSGWDAGSIKITFTNNGSYTVSSFTYTIVRWGRKKTYL